VEPRLAGGQPAYPRGVDRRQRYERIEADRGGDRRAGPVAEGQVMRRRGPGQPGGRHRNAHRTPARSGQGGNEVARSDARQEAGDDPGGPMADGCRVVKREAHGQQGGAMDEGHPEPGENVAGGVDPARPIGEQGVDGDKDSGHGSPPEADGRQVDAAQPGDREADEGEQPVGLGAQAHCQGGVEAGAGGARDQQREVDADPPLLEGEEDVGRHEDERRLEGGDRDVGMADHAQPAGAKAGPAGRGKDEVEPEDAGKADWGAQAGDAVKLEEDDRDDEEEGSGVGEEQDAVFARELAQ